MQEMKRTEVTVGTGGASEVDSKQGLSSHSEQEVIQLHQHYQQEINGRQKITTLNTPVQLVFWSLYDGKIFRLLLSDKNIYYVPPTIKKRILDLEKVEIYSF